MTIKITPNEKGSPTGKLCDAEMHFTDGPLAGLKLLGFAVWERRNGSGRNVTFPSRQYSVNGERRSFALLRAVADIKGQDHVRDLVLSAYARFEADGSDTYPTPGAPSTGRLTETERATLPATLADVSRQTANADDAARVSRMRVQFAPDPITGRSTKAEIEYVTAQARILRSAQPLSDGGSVDPDGFRWAGTKAHADAAAITASGGSCPPYTPPPASFAGVAQAPPAALVAAHQPRPQLIDQSVILGQLAQAIAPQTPTRTTPEQAAADVAAGRPILISSLTPQRAAQAPTPRAFDSTGSGATYQPHQPATPPAPSVQARLRDLF